MMEPRGGLAHTPWGNPGTASESNMVHNSQRNIFFTRMHSSRMRTVHCSSRRWGDAFQHALGRGGDVYPSMHWAGGDVYPPVPWTEFLTHAWESITFLQLRYGR